MHTFKNFKNFEYAEIDLSKPMTLLIGRNGSGKSNVIEGVELLAEFSKGRVIHEISDIEQHGIFEIRGGIKGCFKQGKEAFEIDVKIFLDSPFSNITEKEDYTEWYKVNSDFHIESDKKESLTLKEARRQYGIVNYDINNAIRNIYVFDIYPRVMRQYSPIGLRQLNRRGENISSILYYLKQNKPEILESILICIKHLPEEEFVSFEFITTSDNSDVLFALKYPNGEIISAKLLSDGTLRALAILTALETVPEGSRIIIEEIDNGIHPSKADMLINAIWERSKARKLNTLITTHNPATLDSLNEEQLDCVVVCHYDKQSQSAKLTPFFELPRADLLARGGLGKAVVRNIVEKHLEPDYEQQRRKKSLELLDMLND